MDADSWSARLASASRRYQSAFQPRSGMKWENLDAEMLMGFEELDVDDDIREEFPCCFCSEYFDIVGLCCHIDDEHPVEANNGVCPVCAMRVGIDMVAHITLQHGNIFKVSVCQVLLQGLKMRFYAGAEPPLAEGCRFLEKLHCI